MMHGLRIILTAVVTATCLAACGGGGSGSSGGSTSSGSYSGATNQATLSTANARAVSVDAYNGAQASATLGSVGVVTAGNGGATTDAPLVQVVADTLAASVQRLDPKGATGPAATGASVQVSIPGTYGGTLSYVLNVNETNGSFSGTFTYTNFQEVQNGPFISGVVTFSGVYDQTSGKFSSFSLSFTDFAATESGKTFTMSGTISWSLSSTGTRAVTANLFLRNNTTGAISWVKDYTFTLTAQWALTITGRYYDPVYGYVDISTPVPLQVSSLSGQPTSGVLLFTGASGTSARITFNATGYTVEVDTGTGTFVTAP
ncbi:hypothetical protein [Geobacter sp. AOG1]|uniref:hypothetical protein n=1 Tax=Geobacter sp. AOG1 TaxID=1566346 RepID=UPI001CC6C2AF|nr:hypothetical protein [Geobacter sp. AOG1]GFE59279.1 hypothetical protein AOG1_31590 [Geobacter sp. AOG1]